MGMGASRRKRQVVLFVTAILLPAFVLIGLAARIMRHRREGELQEFIKKDYRAAAEAYRRAMEFARHQAESAEARLLLARALAKAGSADEAWRQYLILLKQGAEARDEQGVAF